MIITYRGGGGGGGGVHGGHEGEGRWLSGGTLFQHVLGLANNGSSAGQAAVLVEEHIYIYARPKSDAHVCVSNQG